ncbi:5-formyltetrahydrofolate cyclo-ligase [Aciduricibacillus chroicocephali]|uniref:5-formyltetrahydrofolate cyclo-ligase n=1 Tax=Aciduricibacillus chroicocephali TaxID=3054939 RepID=UPI003D65F059
MTLNKTELRKQTIHNLKALDSEEKKRIESQMLEILQNRQIWKKAKTVAITVSQGFEWDTKPFIEAAWAAGKTVCVPKCEPESKQLTFHAFTSYDQLEVVYYGLLEPKPNETEIVEKNSIDLIVVPGLMFDKRGYRVGFGGGFYDRYLAGYKNRTVSLVSEDIQLVDHVPNESFDIPVECLITEKTFYNTNAGD